jgi:hypothetical protein
MAAVTANFIRHSIESGQIRVVNLSTNWDRSKHQWRPEEGHFLGNLRLVSPTLSGRAIDALSVRARMLRAEVTRAVRTRLSRPASSS